VPCRSLIGRLAVVGQYWIILPSSAFHAPELLAKNLIAMGGRVPSWPERSRHYNGKKHFAHRLRARHQVFLLWHCCCGVSNCVCAWRRGIHPLGIRLKRLAVLVGLADGAPETALNLSRHIRLPRSLMAYCVRHAWH